MIPALEKNDGVLFMADTVEELAEKIGVPADKLAETIATYNHAAETGMDWDCYKPADWMVPMNEAPLLCGKGLSGYRRRLRRRGDRRTYAGQGSGWRNGRRPVCGGRSGIRTVPQYGGNQEADSQRYVLCGVQRLCGGHLCRRALLTIGIFTPVQGLLYRGFSIVCGNCRRKHTNLAPWHRLHWKRSKFGCEEANNNARLHEYGL